jgi:preprotein translocase subunit SecE
VSDEKPGREDDPRSFSDAELTDEQLDREAPGVDDAGELEAAEDDIAAEAESDEDKVVATPARRRRGRITADDDEDDEPAAAGRVARTSSRPGTGTRSRAEAERARPQGADHLHNGGHRLRRLHGRARGRPGPALRPGCDRRLRLTSARDCTPPDKEVTHL